MSMNPGPMSQSEHKATFAQWMAVFLVCASSIIGGIGLIEWVWPLFWAGVGVFFVGVVVAWASNIMNSVSVWSPPA